MAENCCPRGLLHRSDMMQHHVDDDAAPRAGSGCGARRMSYDSCEGDLDGGGCGRDPSWCSGDGVPDVLVGSRPQVHAQRATGLRPRHGPRVGSCLIAGSARHKNTNAKVERTNGADLNRRYAVRLCQSTQRRLGPAAAPRSLRHHQLCCCPGRRGAGQLPRGRVACLLRAPDARRWSGRSARCWRPAGPGAAA